MDDGIQHSKTISSWVSSTALNDTGSFDFTFIQRLKFAAALEPMLGANIDVICAAPHQWPSNHQEINVSKAPKNLHDLFHDTLKDVYFGE